MAGATDGPIRKFNPGTFQSDQEVTEQFVVRNHELAVLLEVLRGNIDSPSCQHSLIVAPRGRGKTMLLARTAAEIRTSPELARHLLPVRFMEESQEIFSLTDFWLETLFHLARECASHSAQLAQELRDRHAALSERWREQTLEEHARASVLDAADRLDRRLVLMIENLQALCKDVDRDFGWKLRGVLQTEPQIILLASATSRFSGLDDADQPFFEMFRLINLKPLTTEECRNLWNVVSGDTVSGREMRPLEILTGGSPRLLVIVAGFARHKSLRRLMEELVMLIDEHTEYFRGHLDVLGKTERRVYIAVLDLWQLSTPGEIAARARMDVRIVSTMLGRLVKRGALVVEGSGRKRRYAAAEPLYSIYYKLRRGRGEATLVENLIRFMSSFYSQAEKTEIFPALISEGMESPTMRKGLDMAAARALTHEGRALRKSGDLEAAVAICDEAVKHFGTSENPMLRQWVALATIDKTEMLIEMGCIKDALRTCDEFDSRLRNLDDDRKRELSWQAGQVWTRALLAQQDLPTAMQKFRSLYDTFAPDDDTMMREALELIPELIAAGASAHDVLETLSNDRTKADALAPLIIALRQHAGETVRVPEAVLQVAEDIRARMTNG